jgi:hypothetical protein
MHSHNAHTLQAYVRVLSLYHTHTLKYFCSRKGAETSVYLLYLHMYFSFLQWYVCVGGWVGVGVGVGVNLCVCASVCLGVCMYIYTYTYIHTSEVKTKNPHLFTWERTN